MIKTFHKVLCIVLLPLLLTGCWDYLDVDKRAIVISIGVDEVNDQLEFTGSIAKLTSKGGGNITDVYKYWSIGKYFEGSRAHYDARVPTQDFSGAIRSVVFSRKYAETEGIEGYVNRLYYGSDFRSSVIIAVSKEPTKELFAGKVKNDICVGYAVENTMKTLSDYGVAPYKTVQQAKADIEFKDIGYAVPYVTRKGDTIEYLGIAAMKDSKLIGLVMREKSDGFIFLLLKTPVIIIPIPHPEDNKVLISVKNSLKKREIKTEYKNNKINIYIDLKVNAKLRYLYELKPISKDGMKKLEASISEKIKKDIEAALELSKNEFKCDVFGFARYFKADNPEEYKRINWQEEYPAVNFHVNIKTTITNTNLLDINAKKAVK